MRAFQILTFMETLAPPDLAEEWDNCGLQVGSGEDEITRVLLALDCTEPVLDKAEAGTLILTHHPLFFPSLSCLTRESLSARALLKGVTVAAYHTSLDRASGGVNDCLVEALGLTDSTILPDSEGFGRLGTLAPMPPERFGAFVSDALGTVHPRMVCGSRPIRTVAVASGAGGEFLSAAIHAGADAFVTGELKHHQALSAAHAGITVVEAGHFETERVVLPSLQKRLTAAFPALSVEIAPELSPFRA